MRLTLIFTIALAASSVAYGNICPKETTLYYANGMQNTFEQAQRSLTALTQALPEIPQLVKANSRISYCVDAFIGEQLLAAYNQKVGENTIDYWLWLSNLAKAPEWFKESIKKSLVAIANDPNLTSDGGHSFAYQQDILDEKSLVIVAHSQGNLYTNAAIFNMEVFNFPTYNVRYVAVATPAKKVSLGGKYFTLTSDGVIKWIPTALPTNITNTNPAPGLIDHKFEKHYLRGVPTGSQLITTVTQAFEQLHQTSTKETKQCWSWFESLKLKSDATCPLKCKTSKVDMGSFDCTLQCDALCRCKPNPN